MKRLQNAMLCVIGVMSVMALYLAVRSQHVVAADAPVADSLQKPTPASNSYYFYISDLNPTDAGVVAVPSRFKWSIETSWMGIDGQGRDLPDTRVMLRLYDPDHNLTALTAQMDLETAETLQRELADIIANKRRNPNYQHRPQLYDPSRLSVGHIKGINESGEAIIEFESRKAK